MTVKQIWEEMVQMYRIPTEQLIITNMPIKCGVCKLCTTFTGTIREFLDQRLINTCSDCTVTPAFYTNTEKIIQTAHAEYGLNLSTTNDCRYFWAWRTKRAPKTNPLFTMTVE